MTAADGVSSQPVPLREGAICLGAWQPPTAQGSILSTTHTGRGVDGEKRS